MYLDVNVKNTYRQQGKECHDSIQLVTMTDLITQKMRTTSATLYTVFEWYVQRTHTTLYLSYSMNKFANAG